MPNATSGTPSIIPAFNLHLKETPPQEINTHLPVWEAQNGDALAEGAGYLQAQQEGGRF